jgi:hypothetical protein
MADGTEYTKFTDFESRNSLGQHHTDRMPVESRPLPTLVLVPAQLPLGLLRVLLHPVTPVRIFHQAPQRRLRPEVRGYPVTL